MLRTYAGGAEDRDGWMGDVRHDVEALEELIGDAVDVQPLGRVVRIEKGAVHQGPSYDAQTHVPPGRADNHGRGLCPHAAGR